MKPFSAAKPLSPTTARNCFLVNQFATPGLGSLMGGRILPGLGQLLLAVVGFALVMLWSVRTIKTSYTIMTEDLGPGAPQDYRQLIAGGMLFAAAWLWALLTSLAMVRAAKVPEPPPPGNVPPRITNIPPKI